MDSLSENPLVAAIRRELPNRSRHWTDEDRDDLRRPFLTFGKAEFTHKPNEYEQQILDAITAAKVWRPRAAGGYQLMYRCTGTGAGVRQVCEVVPLGTLMRFEIATVSSGNYGPTKIVGAGWGPPLHARGPRAKGTRREQKQERLQAGRRFAVPVKSVDVLKAYSTPAGPRPRSAVAAAAEIIREWEKLAIELGYRKTESRGFSWPADSESNYGIRFYSFGQISGINIGDERTAIDAVRSILGDAAS